ncbi:MAG: radical SAM protein [Ignavibacteriales bacterium]|nr:radical SAM protein [Ignavibacteriales bacterium]
MNPAAALNTVTTRSFTLPIAILYVTAGCNLKCVMCSYRAPLPQELTLDEIRKLADELYHLGLRHIVYSGGEPLTRRDFPSICDVFKALGVKQSLLTNGLLLLKRYDEIRHYFSEIIVSVDGHNAEVHNSIRGMDAFDQIVKGLRAVVSSNPRPTISLRTVVQRKNFQWIGEMVNFAKSLGVDRISFLAADVLSDSFHRDQSKAVADKSEIILSFDETLEFRGLMETFITDHHSEIRSGFVSETPEKLFHIVQYYEALTSRSNFPRNLCNAPMVSTVITSTGDLLPCYFLAKVGNVRTTKIEELLNTHAFRQVRRDVDSYVLDRCQQCVCTLHISPLSAFLDRF